MVRRYLAVNRAHPADYRRPDPRLSQGVRIFVGPSANFADCEVKINGVLHEPSTTALAAMDRPHTEQMTAAKVFLLLVRPAHSGHEMRAGRSVPDRLP